MQAKNVDTLYRKHTCPKRFTNCSFEIRFLFLANMSENGEHCPGVESTDAGKTSACRGCPNQNECSSGQLKAQDPSLEYKEISEKLSPIRHIFMVMSGKGGVGKSSVSSQLARLISEEDSCRNVCLLDADICGPSAPKAMGVENAEVFNSASGWSPVYVEENLSVMSSGFLLGSLDQAVIWRGPKKNGLIKQFLRDVDWSKQDILIIDTPPGTSDEHISLVSFLIRCPNFRGAVLVTTPQEVSQIDVRKQIDFCHRTKLPIIGLVENMSFFLCPCCCFKNEIFKRTKNVAGDLLGENESPIPILGRIPLDPAVGKNVDMGLSIFKDEAVQRATIEAFNTIWNNIYQIITKCPVDNGGDQL